MLYLLDYGPDCTQGNRAQVITRQQQQPTASTGPGQPQRTESSKPKRFSSQRPRQNPEAPSTTGPPSSGNVTVTNAGTLQAHPGGPNVVNLVTVTGQVIPTGVPVSVMSGYPPGPGYYEPGKQIIIWID